ncbi:MULTISPECIES: DUF402 domain-containing protein [unclassified Brevibacterium]|uniref:DUF402 domain-containing protein n=1 Tax=unclassified Brevibacterium TaxID=2614124 RepID=UPI0010F95CDD|nr:MULTISPECIES: DUF402 domain-containing protein [unclassified Brevibacterium]MCM1011203.1 DUF402 domain-containing protein [Brevibacterium sp. XM4083]
MEFSDPFEIPVPAAATRLGEPPFWTPGQAVTWTYRRFDYDLDHVEVRRPMRVIDDGPNGAVLWMPGGTEVVDTGLVGWEGMSAHDVPLDVRFRPRGKAPERIMVPARWQGHGVLKLAPPNAPFSVWVLVKPAPTVSSAAEDSSAESVRVEWYVNLETTHRRTAEAVYTCDLILDITFPLADEPLHRPDGSLSARGAVFKDVHEIAAAGAYGYWPRQWSDTVRANGALILDRLEEFRWAFDPRWEDVALDLAGFGPHEPEARLRLGLATVDDSATRTAAGPDADRTTASARETADRTTASASTISPGQREHQRIPSGCYRRPDSR